MFSKTANHYQKRSIMIRIMLLMLLVTLPVTTFAKKKEKIIMEDITFKAVCDDSEQKYIQILPPRFKKTKKYDVLIALHGHGSDRWQFAKQTRGECRAARETALKKSMIYISPDYRASTSWMGPKAEADVVQIITDIKKKYKVKRIFLCGASMGGSSCLTFVALHPDLIAGVASMNGTANHVEYNKFQGAIKQSFGGSKTEIPEEYKKRSAEFWSEKLTMPISFAVGGKDDIVPADSVLRLAKKLKTANKRNVLLIYRKDGGHNTTYEDAMKILKFIIKKARKK